MRAFTRSFASILVMLGTFSLMTVAARVASAQGVNCTSPGSAAQNSICADADLKALDAKMVSLYAEASRTGSTVKNEIAAQQRQWIESREACGTQKDVKACLTAAYTSRNEALARYATKTSAMDPVIFTCDDHSTLTISFVNGARPLAHVRQGEQFWTLPQVKSASGARYAKGNVSIWNKGKDLTLQLGTRKTHCSTK